MDADRILLNLNKRFPALMAVYAFGSRIQQHSLHAHAQSDLDLGVLVEGYADPVLMFDVANELADICQCPLDLLDIRAASSVMQSQIWTQGQRWWAKDMRASLFEAAMLNEKLYLDAARQGLLNDIAQRGTIYGR